MEINRQIALDAAEYIVRMCRERDVTCQLKNDESDCLSEGADEIIDACEKVVAAERERIATIIEKLDNTMMNQTKLAAHIRQCDVDIEISCGKGGPQAVKVSSPIHGLHAQGRTTAGHG